jgi:DNA-binding NtrC family response regulator
MNAPSADTVANQLSGMRVLVVEDEYYIADDLRRSLSRAGAKIVGPMGSLAQAETALEKGQFDFAVLDLNLHGESAEIVADQLKIMGIPFAIATGYGSSAVPSRHDDVPRLEKPFDPDQVVEVLSRWERPSAV